MWIYFELFKYFYGIINSAEFSFRTSRKLYVLTLSCRKMQGNMVVLSNSTSRSLFLVQQAKGNSESEINELEPQWSECQWGARSWRMDRNKMYGKDTEKAALCLFWWTDGKKPESVLVLQCCTNKTLSAAFSADSDGVFIVLAYSHSIGNISAHNLGKSC